MESGSWKGTKLTKDNYKTVIAAKEDTEEHKKSAIVFVEKVFKSGKTETEGAVASAPWGATNATINYNYTGEW